MRNDGAIAVVDIGATNTRVVLMDQELNEIDTFKKKTVHVDGPPYTHLDDVDLVSFIERSLLKLDQIRPIDTISISAFGATCACLDGDGQLVMPVMDYLAEPPARVVAEYEKIAPAFNEVFANISPSALTLARQIYWLETEFPEAFARTKSIVPWSAYIAARLGGEVATEISNLGVFSHLIDVKSGEYSTLVKGRGWDKLMPTRRNAWDVIGTFEGSGGQSLKGRGEILCGIHDSNANLLRYLANDSGDFTLLSTGTFLIGFDTSADLSGLTPKNDTFSFNDIFGRPIGCGRFYGGYEFGKIIGDADPKCASADGVERVISDRIFVLPSFSDTGGPIAGRGNKGRIIGEGTEDDTLRVSSAHLYYALMINEVLDALKSQGAIIIDGPVAENPILVELIAQLRDGQAVYTSSISEGTTLGAGILAKMKVTGTVPPFPAELSKINPSGFTGLKAYCADWRTIIQQDTKA